jgi:hypothetical protein
MVLALGYQIDLNKQIVIPKDTCSICLTEFENTKLVARLACTHLFCAEDFNALVTGCRKKDAIISKPCPLCKQTIEYDKVRYYYQISKPKAKQPEVPIAGGVPPKDESKADLPPSSKKDEAAEHALPHDHQPDVDGAEQAKNDQSKPEAHNGAEKPVENKAAEKVENVYGLVFFKIAKKGALIHASSLFLYYTVGRLAVVAKNTLLVAQHIIMTIGAIVGAAIFAVATVALAPISLPISCYLYSKGKIEHPSVGVIAAGQILPILILAIPAVTLYLLKRILFVGLNAMDIKKPPVFKKGHDSTIEVDGFDENIKEMEKDLKKASI